MSLIENLTPEQEALIPVYREKWRAIAFSTERIDREKAAEVVKAAYTAIGKQQPEIIFCDSPYARLKIILKKRHNKLNENNINLNNKFINYISSNLINTDLKFSYQTSTQIIRQLTIFETTQKKTQRINLHLFLIFEN
jgi:16S rRNA G966 N2-methylase RsmD